MKKILSLSLFFIFSFTILTSIVNATILEGPVIKFENSNQNLEGREIINVNYFHFLETPIYEISFIPIENNTKYSYIYINSYNLSLNPIPIPGGIIYSYFKIGEFYSPKIPRNNIKLENVEIKFKVDNNWIENNNIKNNNIKLLLFNNNNWKELDTEIIGNINGYTNFKSVINNDLNSLNKIYSIVGEKELEINQTGKYNIILKNKESEQENIKYIILGIVIIIILIILFSPKKLIKLNKK